MASAKSVALPAHEPTVVQRTARAIVRCVSWIFIAWLAFFIVRISVHSVQTHAPWPIVAFIFALPPDALKVVAAATAVCAMGLVPYAYVVWPQPHRRFPGEGVPWYRVAAGALAVGVVVGLVWGLGPHIR